MQWPVLSRTTQLLIGGNVLLAMLVAVQLALPAGPSAHAAPGGGDAAGEMPDFGNAAHNPPALSALSDMLERPVFFVDRKLPEPPKQAAPPPPPPKPLMLQLRGVALAGGTRVALLSNTANRQLLQLAEGESHEGWTLDEVTSTGARFSRGGQVSELLLEPQGASSRR